MSPDVVNALFILIFTALLVGFVLFLWLSVRRSKKNGELGDEPEATEEGSPTDDGLTSDASADSDGADDTEDTDDTDDDLDTDDAWVMPEPESYPARVVDMRVVTGNVGGNKRPKTGVSFLVTFLTNDGKRTEYPVPEELYVTLDIDQTGTLVILNGGFFDFGSGEEYIAAAVQNFEETFGLTDDGESE